MAMITIKHQGSFKNTERFLTRMRKQEIFKVLDHYGQIGVDALAAATPSDTGQTAASWSYNVEKTGRTYSIVWTNSNVIEGYAPLVIMLQYGHGTGTGGYVQGQDFINPALKPVFDDIAESVWKEVQNA